VVVRNIVIHASLAASIATALAAPAYAAAAAAAATDKIELADASDVILVTAQKREEKLQNVPLAVTAASGDTLAKLELRTAIDASRVAPNTNAWGTESRQRPRWFIRGIGSNDVSSNVVTPVAIYNDEVYQNHFSLQGFPLFDIERVEILRGPAGTLWGKNTTGGAFSFVSRKPTQEAEGYARVTIGNYDQRLAEGAFGGPITDKISARASFLYDNRDGFATNRVTGKTAGGVEDFAGRIQVKAELSDTFTALLNVHARDYEGGTNPVLTIGTGAGGVDSFGYATPTNRKDVAYNVEAANQIEAWGGSLNLQWDLGLATLTSITAFEKADRTDLSDSDYTPNEIQRGYAATNVDQVSQELRLTSNDSGPFRWIAGAYFFRDKLDSFGATATLPSPLNRPLAYYYTSYAQKTTSTAVFANASYEVFDRFTIGGGLRYTRDKLSIDLLSRQAIAPVAFSDTTNWFLPTSISSPFRVFATQVDTQKWSRLSYEVKPEYRPADNILLYARFAKGYRSGNFQGNIAPPATLPNVIQPETVYSYEGGFKTSWWNDRITFNATGFYYDYKNIQTTVTTLIPAVGNTPAQTISQVRDAQGWVKGAEFELAVTPVENLRLAGNLGLLKTKYTDLVNSGVRIVGNEFARAPHVTAFGSAEYRIPFGSNALVLGTDWRYNSLFRLNALTQNNSQFDVQPYWVGNVRATVQLAENRYYATLFVNNVTDKDYKIHTLPASNGSFKRFLGDPRTYGVTLGAKF
jgi:iron complex outermembrane receptor protein